MGKSTKRDISNYEGIKQEFNRIVSHPDKLDGEPFLINTNIKVDEVIDLFAKGYNNAQIYKKYPELEKKDLDICKAWQVCNRPETLKATHNLDPDNKFFLIDENLSHYILYDIARVFGYSSHVGVEGLQGVGHNDDEKDIWVCAVNNGYKAILTADSDFIDIASRHRKLLIERYGSIQDSPFNTPVVIRVENNLSRDECLKLIEKHQDDIKEFANTNLYRYAFVGKDGFTAHVHDRTVKKAIKKANDNKPKI